VVWEETDWIKFASSNVTNKQGKYGYSDVTNNLSPISTFP